MVGWCGWMSSHSVVHRLFAVVVVLCKSDLFTEKKKYYEPKVKYGVYLQKMYVPLYTNCKPKKEKKPLPLGYKLKLRSEEVSFFLHNLPDKRKGSD